MLQLDLFDEAQIVHRGSGKFLIQIKIPPKHLYPDAVSHRKALCYWAGVQQEFEGHCRQNGYKFRDIQSKMVAFTLKEHLSESKWGPYLEVIEV